MASKSKRRRRIYATLAIAITAIIVISAAFVFLRPQAAPSEQEVSTFSVTMYTDGEDVSDWLELSIHLPKSSVDFSSDSDYQDLDNFDEEIASKDANDIEIDLSEYEGYGWIEVNPDSESVIMQDMHRISLGHNRNYQINAFHLSSDVYFGITDESDGTIAAPGADGNYTMGSFMFPTYTTTGEHVGDNWDMTDSEFSDLSTENQNEYYDENLYRAQAPQYLSADDSDDNYDDELSRITQAFALKFVMNDTINETDGSVLQVNCTLDDPFDDYMSVLIDGQNMYHVFQKPVTKGATYGFEMQLGANITTSSVQGVRLDTPYDDDQSLSVSTGYSYSLA